MITLDFSGIVHSSVYAFSKDLIKSSPAEMEGIIKHSILTSIKSFRQKFKKDEYGQIVICLDDRHYWRKDIFPYYKANRKKAREDSDLDWNSIFEIVDRLQNDLRENFPYVVLKVNKAEADDIIAVLAKYSQTYDLDQIGFESTPKPFVAVSQDQDFVQLYKYENFKLWQPRDKKYYPKLSKSALREFTIEHVVKAGDDGIPTIMCDDDHFVKEEKVRAKPVSAKRLLEFKEHGRDSCANDIERRNWDRNARLIDFEYIPNDISNAIIEQFENYKVQGNRSKIFNYLIANRCGRLIEDIESF